MNDHATAPSLEATAVRGPAGYVRKLTRASGTNFFYAFLSLPRPRREAIFAVHAFCHAVDDAVDEAPDPDTARARLDGWRRELGAVFDGSAVHPVSRQLALAVERFRLPRTFLEQVIEGVAMDLVPRRYATWDELARYCDLVAGAVGRLAVRIFGADDIEADQYASSLGNALQLTNILRDLGPDARLGRFYLPGDDLQRFSLTEHDVLHGAPLRAALLRFEADRARAFYARAAELVRGRERHLFAAEIMGAIYRALLEAVEHRDFPVEGEVVRLTRARKGWLAVRAWLRCRWATAPRV